jgi:endonuclease YncB( thermonuclease family)
VVGVIDGDTITVLHDRQPQTVRLSGIDCPEKSQDFGTNAKHATSILVFAEVVEVEPITGDRYGRAVAFVRVGATLVNEELICQGMAWGSQYTVIGPFARDERRWSCRLEKGSGGCGRCRSRYRRGSLGGAEQARKDMSKLRKR